MNPVDRAAFAISNERLLDELRADEARLALHDYATDAEGHLTGPMQAGEPPRFKAYSDRPLVYVAAPYAHPDPVWNTHDAILLAADLQLGGSMTCFVPHQTLLWHLIDPQVAEHWYAYDLAMLARCDALFRMEGESTGADREVEFALDHDIPVFRDEAALLEWTGRR